ncbi:MAG: hypothetical protein QG650_759 [Patescibacteria group bacterium]|nr:hypothetical protein [Patescibacteria group bacterium]
MHAKSLIIVTLSGLLLASCGKETEIPKKRLSFTLSET